MAKFIGWACALAVGSAVADLPSACSQPNFQPGVSNVTISSGGRERIFTLYTPRTATSYSALGPPSSPAPLVMHWHGCNAHHPLMDYHTEITRVIDQAQDRTSQLQPWYAIVPLGTQEIAGDRWGWNTIDGGIHCGAYEADDGAFAEDLLDFVAAELCVDTSRVYTAGFSTGAFLSYGIGCTMSARVAGVAANSGSVRRDFLAKCKSGEPVPVQSFHSLADPTVPYHGTLIWASQDEVDDMWRTRNGCNGGAEEGPVIVVNSSTTTCRRWMCPGAPVETCTIGPDEAVPVGLDHCWIGGRSGGFPTCVPRLGDVDATAHMFDFWDSLAQQASSKMIV